MQASPRISVHAALVSPERALLIFLPFCSDYIVDIGRGINSYLHKHPHTSKQMVFWNKDMQIYFYQKGEMIEFEPEGVLSTFCQ